MTFNEAWSRIRALPSGSKIQKWSSVGRALGSFTLVSADATSVIVKSDGIDNERRVPLADFETVFGVWADYCGGVVPRKRINTMIQNSTYVLALLHWAESTTPHQSKD